MTDETAPPELAAIHKDLEEAMVAYARAWVRFALAYEPHSPLRQYIGPCGRAIDAIVDRAYAAGRRAEREGQQ